MVDENVYPLVIATQRVASGIVLALVLALLGSLPPAMRAGRLPVIQALRAQ
jgi:ABC-type lipoprotein release transport system permease subunit